MPHPPGTVKKNQKLEEIIEKLWLQISSDNFIKFENSERTELTMRKSRFCPSFHLPAIY